MKKPKIVVAPSFYESFMDNVPEEDREEVMEAVLQALEEIKENPYIATPIVSGPFGWIFIFTNWCKRQIRRFELWRKRGKK